jgi:hypothetical protein
MTQSSKITILFTGYAPVHFVCFKRIYDRLVTIPQVDIFVSGGLRTKTANGPLYNPRKMYEPFGIPAEKILPLQKAQNRKFDILFSASSSLLVPLMNCATRVQLFHGVSFRNRAVKAQNLAYNVLFLIGPHMLRLFNDTGLLPENDPRAIPIGFPKTDPLLNGELDRNTLLKQYGLTGTRPVLLFAPTGEMHNALETMGKEVISRLSDTGKYDLLIKPHDHPKNTAIDWQAELAPLQGDHVRIVTDHDVIPLLFLADLLITDASSVANEYTLLNRPIVFLDVPDLIKVTKGKLALIDSEDQGRRGGLLVKRPQDIAGAVAKCLAAPESLAKIRKDIAQNLFFNPGCATEAAIDWFEKRYLD